MSMLNKYNIFHPQVITSVQTIDTTTAHHLLTYNSTNRKVRRNRVLLYAEEMKQGKWMMTGEPIIISSSGTLLNGQHRLLAVLESGIPLTTVVVEGVPDEAFKNIDNNLTRRTSDVLYQAGVTDASHSAAIIRMYMAVDAGITPTSTAAMALVTRADITDWAVANEPRLNHALTMARGLNTACGGNRTAWGVLYLLIEGAHGQQRAEDFCDSLIAGSNLGNTDPRLTLRNWTMRMKGKFNASVFLGTSINVYNAFSAGRPLALIRPWTSDRPFPVIK